MISVFMAWRPFIPVCFLFCVNVFLQAQEAAEGLHITDSLRFSVDVGLVDGEWLERAGFRQTQSKAELYTYEEVLQLQQRILRRAAEHGYPLAIVRLDSLRFDENIARAILRMEHGPLIRYGDMQIRGDAGIAVDVLQRLLHLPKGRIYNQNQVEAVPQALKALPYLELAASPQWLFIGSEAIPVLQLKKKKASSFDFLFGLNSRSNPGGAGFSFTGQLRADFFNAFRYGERFQMQYEQLPTGTRKLMMGIDYPFLGPLPVGAYGRFEQFKQDTSFSDLLWRIGAAYPINISQRISMYWQGNSSTLITTDTARIKATRQLPDQLDFEQRGAGVEIHIRKQDNPINPRKGWSLQTDFSFRSRKIPVNPLISGLKDPDDPAFDFASLYDGLKNSTAQIRLNVDFSMWVPVFQYSALYFRLNAAHIANRGSTYQNELFQLGGYYSLRGFDERSLRASSYAVTTLEYRWLTGADTRFYLFADYAWLEEVSVAQKKTEHPLGVGAGLTFATPAGQLAVNLAFGKLQAQQFDWRNPKIHLGYVGRF